MASPGATPYRARVSLELVFSVHDVGGKRLYSLLKPWRIPQHGVDDTPSGYISSRGACAILYWHKMNKTTQVKNIAENELRE